MDARELANRLTRSADGHQLAAMLEKPSEVPPPESLPLPETTALPEAVPLPTLLPAPPPRHEDRMAPYVPSTDALLGEPNGRQPRPPPEEDGDGDDDIQWH